MKSRRAWSCFFSCEAGFPSNATYVTDGVATTDVTQWTQLTERLNERCGKRPPV